MSEKNIDKTCPKDQTFFTFKGRAQSSIFSGLDYDNSPFLTQPYILLLYIKKRIAKSAKWLFSFPGTGGKVIP